MTPHTLPAVRSVAAALVLLAGVTGLLWPKSNMQAEDKIEPVPVRTLSYPSPIPTNSNQLQPGLPEWLRAEDAPVPPAWTMRDGMWIPWTMQPPAWWTTIASSHVVAETVPVPPERPRTAPLDDGGLSPESGPEHGSSRPLERPKG
jgi:hypothetical protein